MDFTGDMASFQQSVALSHEVAMRRAAVFEALAPRNGEHVLDVGCGGGAYLRDVAFAVGPHGRACGIDISEDQVAAAQALCADAPGAEISAGSALDLPFDEASLDAAYSAQVLEYIDTIDDALSEIHRVLKPGGRFVHLATNWGSVIFNAGDETLMDRVMAAWDTHCPHPNLPASMARRLRGAGFGAVEQTPLPMLITSNHQHSFTYWATRVMAGLAVAQDAVSATEAEAWLADLDELDRKGEFFYSAMTVITRARKAN